VAAERRLSDTNEEPTALAPEARPDRVIAVLGMHRSGTSALVGSLQQRGLFLGRHSTRNAYNLRGNRENPDVMRLNEDILEHSGGSWHAPPPAVQWGPGHVERARGILGEYAERPLWGFKDPRTLLTLDGWLRLVPDLEFVGVFRHPARVARSLAGRPALQVGDPVEVWRLYNARLLELHRRSAFPVVCFDDEAGVLARNLDRVAEMLGLPPLTEEESFFTEDLRRMEAEPAGLPADVSALYEELRTLAL
jgi:hypothetical protein